MNELNKKVVIDIFDSINYLDVDKIHDVMTYLNWEWVLTEGVPEPEEIRNKAFELLLDSYLQCKGDSFTISTGGLECTCFKDDEGAYCFSCKFILTETM